MPRIVSGTGQEVNSALLEGLALGQSFRQARDRRAQLQLDLQEQQLKLNKERTKALEDANLRAQRGELDALMHQELERRIEGLPPDKKRLIEFSRLDSSITDPKLKAELRQSFGEVEGEIKLEESYKAADEQIARAEKDQLFDENEILDLKGRSQAKRARKEPVDDLMTEIGGRRKERAAAAQAAEENSVEFGLLQQQYEAMPPGPAKTMVGEALKDYELSPSAQEKSGSAKRLGASLGQMLTRQQQIQEEEAKHILRGGEYDGKVLRYPPARQVQYQKDERAEREKLKVQIGSKSKRPKSVAAGVDSKIPKVVSAALQGGAASHQDILASLKEQGIPITRENLEAARAQIEEWTNQAGMQGGADVR